nr:MAG: PB2 [Byreska virus]
MEESQRKAKKELLMMICQKINKSSPGARKILKETPICNLRQIAREAKNVKDPNPLQTMMNSISQKWPITVDKEKARKCGLPKEFLGGKDIHGFGRRLCKLDAIQWYVQNCGLPSDDVRESIRVLFKTKTEQVSEYYEWDWANGVVYFGDKMMVRAMVNMNKPLVELPQRQRNQYIIAAMFPEQMINWRCIDSGILEKMSDLKRLTIDAKLPIISQIRILSSFADPKPRMIPTCPSIAMSAQPIRHAFASHNHLIRVSKILLTTEVDKDAPLEMLGKCISYLINKRVGAHELFNNLANATVGNHKIKTLASASNKANIFIDLVRSMFEIPAPLVKEVMRANFYPQMGNVTSVMMQNLVGTKFYVYYGNEKINIQYEEGTACVQRNGNYLVSIKASPMSEKTVTGLIARLAMFMKWQFIRSKKRSIKQMSEECFNRVLQFPWEFLSDSTNTNITKKDYQRCVNQLRNFGPVEFTKEQITCTAKRVMTKINGREINYKNYLTIPIMKPRDYPILSLDFCIGDEYFSHFFEPIKRLRKRFEFYSATENFSRMLSHIGMGDYEWENFSISVGIQESERSRIMATAKSIILSMISKLDQIDRRFLILAYCFAGNTTAFVDHQTRKMSFEWYGTISVDFTGTSGAVRIDENGVLIDNQIVQKQQVKIGQDHLFTFYPGWRLLANPHAGAKLKPIFFLKDPTIKNGFIVKVMMNGRTIYLKRDATAANEASTTIQRQILARENELNSEKPWFITERKRRMTVENSENEAGPSKMIALESQSCEDFYQADDYSDSD